MWPVLPEAITRSRSVASIDVQSDLRLEAKLPASVPVAFFMQICTRWPFCLQKYTQFFISYNIHIACGFSYAAVAC